MLLLGGQAKKLCWRTWKHPVFVMVIGRKGTQTSLFHLRNLLGRFSLLLQLAYTKCSCTGTLQACARANTHTHTHTKCVLQHSTWHLHHLITHYCWIHLHHQTVSYEEETDFFNRTKTFMWPFSHNMEPDCCLLLHSLLLQSSVPSCCLPMT